MTRKIHAMIGCRYGHLTTHHEYEVVDIATIEATLEPGVVYRSVQTGARWIRPLEEFCDGRFVFTDDPAWRSANTVDMSKK